MSAGKMVLKYGTHHLGKSILEQIQYAHACHTEAENKKTDVNRSVLSKFIDKAEQVKTKHNGGVPTTDSINTWNCEEITHLLRTYRRKGEKIPSTKKKLVDLFHQWKDRPITTWNGRAEVIDLSGEDQVENTQAADPLVGVPDSNGTIEVASDLTVEVERKLANGSAVAM